MANRCCNCCANAWWCWANGVSGGGCMAPNWWGADDCKCGTPLLPDVVSLVLPEIVLLLFVPLFVWVPVAELDPEPVAFVEAAFGLLPPPTTPPLLLPAPPVPCIAFAWYCCWWCCCCWAWFWDCCCCGCCCCWAELILLVPPVPSPTQVALAKMELEVLWPTVDDKIEPFALAVELLAAVELL